LRFSTPHPRLMCSQGNLQAPAPMRDAAAIPDCSPTCHQYFLVATPADRHFTDVALLPETRQSHAGNNSTVTWCRTRTFVGVLEE
jgi:hypothetical protein